MTIETPDDINGLLKVGRIVAETLAYLREQTRPGITTGELDALAARFLHARDARSAPVLTYRFPGTTCISINDEAAHGIPGNRIVQPGDLVKFDVSAEHNGYYADAAITVAVPPQQSAHVRLCACAEAALTAGIAATRAGQPLNVIGHAAERVARQYGYSIVRELHGHGVGRGLHEAPGNIPQYHSTAPCPRLSYGSVITIEPHVATRAGRSTTDPNGWTIRTRDGGYVAMVEHTIIVTHAQPIVVTRAVG